VMPGSVSLWIASASLLGSLGLAQGVILGLYPPDSPFDNKLTSLRVNLGEIMFFDRRLSSSGDLSCSSCHQPEHAYADTRVFSPPNGKPVHRRNASSVLNAAYRRSLGWEGHARTLEQQVESAFGPYGDLGISLADALKKIERESRYIVGCKKAYGSAVDSRCLTRAIGSFERSLTSAGSRFDRYLFGGDKAAITSQEEKGWIIFSGRGACIDCHDVFHSEVNPLGGAYATFSDERFHNLGVGYRNGRMSDVGRFEITRDPEDLGAFKTPMLRNVSKTAPYMHDGSLATLEDVVNFYNQGGTRNPHQSSGIKPLYLTEDEKTALVSFLRALDADYYAPSSP